MIRVLEVIEATTAGVKTYVLNLVRHLDRTRFDLTVACPPVRVPSYGDISFVSDVQEAGVRVLSVPMRRALNPVRDLAAAWHLARIFRRQTYDVVHLHSSKAGLIGRLAVIFSGRRTPVIYTPNAFAFLGRRGLDRWLYAGAERCLGRWTTVLMCVSAAEREIALANRLIAPERAVVIENAVATLPERTPAAIAAARHALSLPPDAPIVGCVGRLATQKGLGYLIDAAPAILARVPQARFVLVGSGELRDSLERQAQRLGVRERVIFAGYQPEAAALMPAFDCLAMPSLYEAFSLVLLEAMLVGIPLVVTGIPGFAMVKQGETGLVVPPRDADILAENIVRLLCDRTLSARLGAAGRDFALTHHDLARQIQQVERLYEALAMQGIKAQR